MPEDGRAARDWSPEAGRTGASSFTLKKTPEFMRLFRSGQRFKGVVIRARHCRNTLGIIRLGFSVSRKTGNAVQRNLFRRRMRHLAREASAGPGFDAVVTPQLKLWEIGWSSLCEDFAKLLREAGR